MAWNALGRIGSKHPEAVGDKKEEVEDALAYSTASAMGALLFLDNMVKSSGEQIFKDLVITGMQSAAYRVPKALFSYYVFKSPHFENPLGGNSQLTCDIKQFFSAVQQNYNFTQEDFNEGLRLISMLGSHQTEFWEGTPHLEIAKRLVYYCGHYIVAIGAFFIRGYEKEGKSNFDFWTLLTR